MNNKSINTFGYISDYYNSVYFDDRTNFKNSKKENVDSLLSGCISKCDQITKIFGYSIAVNLLDSEYKVFKMIHSFYKLNSNILNLIGGKDYYKCRRFSFNTDCQSSVVDRFIDRFKVSIEDLDISNIKDVNVLNELSYRYYRIIYNNNLYAIDMSMDGFYEQCVVLSNDEDGAARDFGNYNIYKYSRTKTVREINDICKISLFETLNTITTIATSSLNDRRHYIMKKVHSEVTPFLYRLEITLFKNLLEQNKSGNIRLDLFTLKSCKNNNFIKMISEINEFSSNMCSVEYFSRQNSILDSFVKQIRLTKNKASYSHAFKIWFEHKKNYEELAVDPTLALVQTVEKANNSLPQSKANPLIKEYHSRVLRWFGSSDIRLFRDKGKLSYARQTDENIKQALAHHQIPFAVDRLLDSEFIEQYSYPTQTGRALVIEITYKNKYSDLEPELGLMTYGIDDKGIVYHRCFSKKEQPESTYANLLMKISAIDQSEKNEVIEEAERMDGDRPLPIGTLSIDDAMGIVIVESETHKIKIFGRFGSIPSEFMPDAEQAKLTQ